MKVKQEIQHYSKFVKYSKLICIGLAAVIFLLVLAIPKIHPSIEQINLKFGEEKQYTGNNIEEKSDLIIVGSHLFGVNQKHGPYNIKADKLFQSGNVIKLEKINSSLDNLEDLPIELSSDTGFIYSDKNHDLFLQNNVVGKYGKNYLFTEELIINKDEILSLFSTKVTSDLSYIISNSGLRFDLETNTLHLLGRNSGKYYTKNRAEYTEFAADNIFYNTKKATLRMYGNVNLVHHDDKIICNELLYNNKDKDNVLLYGNVEIYSPQEKIQGNKAIYSISKNILTVFDKVKVTRDNNTVNGSKFIYNISTKQGKIISDGKENKVRANLKIK
jgi:lipopolysaccharide export system protein LptA